MLLRNRFLVVALIAFWLASTSRAAQAQNGRCPAVTRRTQHFLNDVEEVFESADWSDARRLMKVERVPATAIKLQVVDDSLCQALSRATVKALPEVYELKPGQAELYLMGHRLFYFRIGDYYAVLPELNPPVPVRGYGTLFIFRVPASQGGRDDAVGRILQFLGMRDSRDLKFLGAPLW